MAIKYKMAEVRDFFIGKRIYFYNSFDGSHRDFIIGKVINKVSYIEVQPKNNPNLWVFINKNRFPALLVDGKVIYNGEIEGVTFEVITEIKQWHI